MINAISTLSRITGRKELAVAIGVSLPTLDRMHVGGRIGPPSIQVSQGRVGWLRSSVDRWIASAERLGRLPNQTEWVEITAAEAFAPKGREQTP